MSITINKISSGASSATDWIRDGENSFLFKNPGTYKIMNTYNDSVPQDFLLTYTIVGGGGKGGNGGAFSAPNIGGGGGGGGSGQIQKGVIKLSSADKFFTITVGDKQNNSSLTLSEGGGTITAAKGVDGSNGNASNPGNTGDGGPGGPGGTGAVAIASALITSPIKIDGNAGLKGANGANNGLGGSGGAGISINGVMYGSGGDGGNGQTSSAASNGQDGTKGVVFLQTISIGKQTGITSAVTSIEKNLKELHQLPGTQVEQMNTEYNATMVAGAMWTVLASTLVYYVFTQL